MVEASFGSVLDGAVREPCATGLDGLRALETALAGYVSAGDGARFVAPLRGWRGHRLRPARGGAARAPAAPPCPGRVLGRPPQCPSAGDDHDGRRRGQAGHLSRVGASTPTSRAFRVQLAVDVGADLPTRLPAPQRNSLQRLAPLVPARHSRPSMASDRAAAVASPPAGSPPAPARPPAWSSARRHGAPRPSGSRPEGGSARPAGRPGSRRGRPPRPRRRCSCPAASVSPPRRRRHRRHAPAGAPGLVDGDVVQDPVEHGGQRGVAPEPSRCAPARRVSVSWTGSSARVGSWVRERA